MKAATRVATGLALLSALVGAGGAWVIGTAGLDAGVAAGSRLLRAWLRGSIAPGPAPEAVFEVITTPARLPSPPIYESNVLFRPAGSSAEWRVIGTCAEDSFEFRSREIGDYRLECRLDGEMLTSREISVRSLPWKQQIVLNVAERMGAELRGRLVASDGSPLSRDDLSALFPQLTVRNDVFPESPGRWRWLGGANALIAVPHGLAASFHRIHQGTRVDFASADFSIPVAADFDGEVQLFFRSQLVARSAWRAGDAPVELEVDVRSLERGQGAVQLEIVDAASGAAVEDATVIVHTRRDCAFDPWLSYLVGRTPATAVIADLPQGDLEIEVDLDGRLGARTTAAVRGGETAAVRVALAPPAQLRVWLPDRDPAAWPLEARSVRVASRSGRELLAVGNNRVIDGRSAVVFERVPAGPSVLRLDEWALAVDLAPGANPDVTFPTPGKPHGYALQWRAVDPPSGGFLPRLPAHVTLAQRGIVVLDSVESLAIDERGETRLALKALPGVYDLQVDLGDLGQLDRELTLPERGGTVRIP